MKLLIIALILISILISICMYIYTYKEKNTFPRMSLENINKNIRKRKNRVVVSFSTIPSRVKYIPKVIEEILKQNFQPDAIYVCVPYYSKRLKKQYILPVFEDMGDNVKIVRGTDYGPATKLLGCIPHENDPNTMIITIDDDQKYTPDIFKYLVSYGEEYPDSVISFDASDKNFGALGCPKTRNYQSPASFYAEGFSGVLYRRGFISEKMINYFENNLSKDCFVSDDLTISTWMEIQGKSRKKICDIGSPSKIKEDIDENDALHRLDRNGVYTICHKEMMELIKSNETQPF
jgi:hypothetical protein